MENLNTNQSKSPEESSFQTQSNLGLSSDENDSNLNNSLNVYGMQTNISGHTVKFTDLKTPYKLGDCMYMINSESSKVNRGNNLFVQNTNLPTDHSNTYLSDSSDYSDTGVHKQSLLNKSTESLAKQSFHIHQSMPDREQYDLYTREKDELCSFVCHGKRAEIFDSDYQDMDEIKPQQKNNMLLYELMVSLKNDSYSCFVHIKDDLILLATRKGQFNLLRPNKSKFDFIRCILNPKFNGNDADLYRQGVKTLVDICLDSKGDLILLNRWRFIKESGLTPEEKSVKYTYKYTIELFSFNKKLVDGISYARTICCLSDERANASSPTRSSPAKSPPEFTRIYNDEKKNSIILIDLANNKIYWFAKSNGAKKRCLKSEDSTLKEPKSLTLVENLNGLEITFICTKSGLIASNKNFTIKHDVSKLLIDICYDSFEKCLFFIDSMSVFGGKIVPRSGVASSGGEKENTFLLEQQTQTQSEKNSIGNLDSMDLRYKCLFSYVSEKRKSFRRVISSKNYLFIMSEPLSESASENSIYAFDKSKQTF